MAFRLFSVFITVLICLTFEEVNSLDCARWCHVDCKFQEVNKDDCFDANSKCDCTAVSYEQIKGLIEDNRADSFNELLGLVLGVTFFVVIVGIIGCFVICYLINQLRSGAGYTGALGSGGAIYVPSPSTGYQPAGTEPSPLTV